MEKTSPDTFKMRFGDSTAAALAVIVEDEEKDKKRLIHDATHGVRVNHRIKCRDKLRAPGTREKKQLLLDAMDKRERPFLIVGDIKKAHRRFKPRQGAGFSGLPARRPRWSCRPARRLMCVHQ